MVRRGIDLTDEKDLNEQCDKLYSGGDGKGCNITKAIVQHPPNIGPTIQFFHSTLGNQLTDPFGDSDDGQDRRITQRLWDQCCISNVEILGEPIVME